MEISDLKKYNIDPKVVTDYLEKINNQESIVVVTGEFSSGKTCFVNAFLGVEDFLPHSNGECTPVLVDIIESMEQNLVVKYKNGLEEKVSISRQNVHNLTKYNRDYDSNILAISIPAKSKYLSKNTHFIDSPGTNTILKEHEEITKYILKKADIVIYVFNKVVAETDINNIAEIQKYTDEIIFVLTHMDLEKEGILEHRTEQDMQRFVDEAKEQLKLKLNIEDADVLPIGSKAAFKDAKYIEKIRSCVKEYQELNSGQIIKKRVAKQLSKLFEEKLKELEQTNNLFIKTKNMDKEELEQKLISFNGKVANVKNKQQSRKNLIEIAGEEVREKVINQIKKLFKVEEENLISGILSNEEIATELLEKEFQGVKENLGQDIRKLLEKQLDELVFKVYSNINEDLRDLVSTMEIKLDANISEPILEDLDKKEYEEEIKKFVKIQKQCIEQISQVEKEIAISKSEKEEISQGIEVVNDSIKAYRQELQRLGYYVPEYEEIVVDGGGADGAKLGRFLGEVADIALIFANPAGAAAKTADVAKDSAKALSYVQKTLKLTKNQTAEKILDLKKEADKVKDIIGKVDETRIKVKEYGEKIKKSKEASEGVIDGIGKMLDVLSIGYWGEKIGQSIGEVIKPTKTIIEENMERKREWEEARAALQQSIDEQILRQKELEKDLKSADTIKESLKLKRDLENRKTRYEELVKEMEKKYEKHKEEDIRIQFEKYYKKEISGVFENEYKRAESTAVMVLQTALHKLMVKSETDFEDKIKELELQIEKIQSDKLDIEKEIEKNTALIEELGNYGIWIEKWVTQYESV